jgi:hypothetical protein
MNIREFLLNFYKLTRDISLEHYLLTMIIITCFWLIDNLIELIGELLVEYYCYGIWPL